MYSEGKKGCDYLCLFFYFFLVVYQVPTVCLETAAPRPSVSASRRLLAASRNPVGPSPPEAGVLPPRDSALSALQLNQVPDWSPSSLTTTNTTLLFDRSSRVVALNIEYVSEVREEELKSLKATKFSLSNYDNAVCFFFSIQQS